MMKRILALDLSSTTTGWAVIGIEEKKVSLLDLGFIKPEKEGSLYYRLASFKAELSALFKRVKPEEIILEEIATYMPRKSSANTIIILAVFNRMASLLAYEFLGKEPKHYPVMTIRHGLKTTTIPPEKHEVPALIEKHLGIKIPKKLKRTGNPIDEYYDQADAIAVGLYYAYLITNQLTTIPKVYVAKPKKRAVKTKVRPRLKKAKKKAKK